MKRFNPDSKCVKCGAGVAGASFESEGRNGFLIEVIVRKCVCCGYEWLELPLDSTVMPLDGAVMETE